MLISCYIFEDRCRSLEKWRKGTFGRLAWQLVTIASGFGAVWWCLVQPPGTISTSDIRSLLCGWRRGQDPSTADPSRSKACRGSIISPQVIAELQDRLNTEDRWWSWTDSFVEICWDVWSNLIKLVCVCVACCRGRNMAWISRFFMICLLCQLAGEKATRDRESCCRSGRTVAASTWTPWKRGEGRPENPYKSGWWAGVVSKISLKKM